MRNKFIDESKVLVILDQAETQMEDNEYEVKPWHVMKLVSETRCSAYDCEFAALAEDLQVPLITTDKKLAENFPKIAKALKDYIQ